MSVVSNSKELVVRHCSKISNLRPILSIEFSIFKFPWKQSVFKDTLDEETCSAITVEINNEIVGYALIERQQDRIYIIKLAVAETNQRKGVGKAIIDEVKNIGAKLGKAKIEFDVRESLLPSHLFLSSPKIAFKAVEVVREGFQDYKVGVETPINIEDAYKFIFDLPQASSEPELQAAEAVAVLVA